MKKFIFVFGTLCLLVGGALYFTYRDYRTIAWQQQYPQSMGSISCDTLIQQASAIPPNLKQAVDLWVQNNQKLVTDLLILPQFTSIEAMKIYIKKIQDQVQDRNVSKHNYIFDIESDTAPAVIKIAGIPSRISSMISSLGYDPYTIKWWTRDDLINRATNKTIPTQQHITRAATQQLLAQVKIDGITPIATYLYHLEGRPTDCDDRNYIIVQEKLSGFSRLASLSPENKKEALEKMNLKELYTALKYANLWNMSENNLWLNKTFDIAYPDGEKPNNEGHGVHARWKVAILGHDLEKAKFNIRNWFDGGHRSFEKILQRYLPERVEEWMKLYEQDPDFSK